LDVGQNLFPGIELLRSKKMTHASSGYCTGEHMQTEQLTWHYDGATIELGADWSGQGRLVLLLPALSSISTRREMRPLQERLCAHYQTVSTDWPGFGDRPRLRHDWRPEIYSDFLTYLVDTVLPPLHAVIAAGHAATFALLHACARPGSFKRLVLIAPTWRGPLPTMMNGRRPLFDRICRIVDLPVIGPLLYGLNVNRFVIRYMAAGHVYADAAWLDGQRLRDKLAVTRPPGARFASVRFVAGKLDPLATRSEFLDLAHRSPVPILMVYGAQTPSRSRAEMEALASVHSIQGVMLPRGKLSVHEEFPNLVAETIEPFLLDRS
jgi:pimeloyl-ACP methyl ester carboxylesterase